MPNDVAILIVTYNSEQQITACLQSALDQRRNVTQQIVVVDNNSTDGTVALIREKFPMVKLLTPGQNLGFAKGVNLAARNADAEFLLLLNPDTEVLDHAVDVVVEFARAHPHYGLYGGKTLKPNGSLEPSSCWGLPSLWSLFLYAFALTTIAPRNRWLDPESLGSWPRDTVREVGIITGCFLLVGRTAWEKLAGLDERYFMYGEDADFSMRARRAGYRPVICPTAQVMHEVGQSSSTPLRKALLLYKGKACYIRTHWTGLKRSLGLGLLLIGVGVRTTAGVLLRKRDQPWKGLWQQRAEWIKGYPKGSH
ncbi:MAG: glycosyltransferase family 2 protein [Verrucomicrobia bacterium]|nr:glycosyltransferase family 2 protein [Verrucomicrobiota bacterium]